MSSKKHDHRQSLWIIRGDVLWCYRCGAWRAKSGTKWWKPTGLSGENPAMRQVEDVARRELKKLESA